MTGSSMPAPPRRHWSLRLSANRGSEHLEDAGRAHAATDAHRHHHLLRAATLAFDQRMAGEALAADAVGMADGDRAAIDVEPVDRDPERVGAIQHLHRERLVQLPEVDVGDREAESWLLENKPTIYWN